MRLSLVGGVTAVVLLIAALVGYSTFFSVYQTRQALVVRLGNPVRVITEPGLNVKVPFVDTVIYIDKRILNIEQPAQEVIASSGDSANTGAGQAGERLVSMPSRATASSTRSNIIRRSGPPAPVRNSPSCSIRRCVACSGRRR